MRFSAESQLSDARLRSLLNALVRLPWQATDSHPVQLDTAEAPRSKALYPDRYVDGGPWKDLSRTRWSG
jgi:hypothetical protein